MLADYSQAQILRQALVDAGLVTLPSAASAWPMAVSRMDNEPNEQLGIYDTEGTPNGRHLRDGETKRHYGWQIRSRAREYPVAREKLAEIANWLDTVTQLAVSIASSNFTIHAVSQSGDIIHLRQTDELDREHFTLNGVVSIT